jgi:hypothetical protein
MTKFETINATDLAHVVGGNDMKAYQSIESQRPGGGFPSGGNATREGLTPNMGGPRWENSPSGGGGGGGGTPQRPKGGPPRNMSVPRIR